MARTSTARRRVDPTSPFPFNKVLIANRGEIAVRVIRACRDLGLASVAVYSDADRLAPHVRMADEACIWARRPPRESYLNPQKLIEAALRTGAGAIHPGYGFLSENADFADACAAAGCRLRWPARTRDARDGREDGGAAASRSRRVCRSCPAMTRDWRTRREAARWAEKHRLPSDAQGGGGRRRQGHSLRPAAEELESAFRLARSEAQGAFGDSSVYLEKAVIPARHIEVADSRRYAWQRHPPGRARVLDPAAPPEADRGVALGRAGRRRLRGELQRGGGAAGAGGGLRQRGDLRVSAGAGRRTSTSWKSTRACRWSIP